MPLKPIEFAFDVTNVDVFVSGSDPVPSGTYVAAISDMEVRANNKQETGHNLALQLTITEGQYKGRKVFENLNLWHKTSSAAAEIAMKQLSSIGHAVGVLQGNDLTQLSNKPMLIEVELTPQQPDSINQNTGEPVKGRGPSNNILRHDPVTQESYAAAQGHVPAAAGAVNTQNAAAAKSAPAFNPAAAQQANAQASQAQAAASAPAAQAQAAPAQSAPAGAVPPWMQNK